MNASKMEMKMETGNGGENSTCDSKMKINMGMKKENMKLEILVHTSTYITTAE